MNKKSIILCIVIMLLLILALIVGVFIGKRSGDNKPKKETTSVTIKTEKLTDKEYSILLNETINIEDMSIELVNVDDSRCPAYAECYWPGELAYDILINGSSYEISTVNKPQLDYKNYTLKIVGNKCSNGQLIIEIERK